MTDIHRQHATQIVKICVPYMPFLLDPGKVATEQFTRLTLEAEHKRQWLLAQLLWQRCTQHWHQDTEMMNLTNLVALRPADTIYQDLLINALAKLLQQTPTLAQACTSLLSIQTPPSKENRIEAEDHSQVVDSIQEHVGYKTEDRDASNILIARGHSTVSNVRQGHYADSAQRPAASQSVRQTHAVSVVMLTSQRLVYQALRSQLSDVHEEVQSAGTIYERGRWQASEHTFAVGLAEIEDSQTDAAWEAERAISYFQPKWALFVGLAAGIKDVHNGDVVVATKVYDYEAGKADDELLPRPEVAQSSYALIQRARAEARKAERVSSEPGKPSPRVFIGPIAAGEKLLTSRDSALYAFIQRHFGDTLAIELNGYGFLRATHANQQVGALVLRGISHQVGEQESIAAVQAAQQVSAFVSMLLVGEDLRD